MLRIHTSERIEESLDALAAVLSDAPADPLTPEWIAVPSEGVRRWMALQLAGRLGVMANARTPSPGRLRLEVLAAPAAATGGTRQNPDADPWQVEPLTWVVLAAARRLAANGDGPLRDLAEGASAYARARRIADLFDRYHVRRADMIRHWAAGDDLDGAGRLLDHHHLWQPRLWREVRDAIGTPSPPERIPALLDRLHAADLDLGDLPGRLSIFGVSSLPGGADFLDLADAVATTRDLHLFLLEPSCEVERRVASSIGPPGVGVRTRADDATAELVTHPLLRSWGRLHRESAVLIADAVRQGVAPVERAVAGATDSAPLPARATLLTRLQHDIRSDRAPTPAPLIEGDRSVQIHRCFGPRRQVEAMRDIVLHLLEDDPTLSTDDIVVICPDLERSVPLLDAVLGPPGQPSVPTSGRTPTFCYRLADRSVGRVNPVLAATDALLELVAGRFEVTAVLDFLTLQPIRERFGLTDEALDRIGSWVAETHVRWGLDADHRERFGGPSGIRANSWRSALEQLFCGSVVSDDGSIALGQVAPHGVDSGDLVHVGQLADLLAQLADLADHAQTPRSLHEWLELLEDAAGRLFSVPRSDRWQTDGLRRALAELGAAAASVQGATAAAGGDVLLTFADLRRALADHLGASAGRPDFFRGGVTVSSLTPLRWIPFRVVIVLGADQAAFNVGAIDGDDLAAQAPLLGDQDRRAELRQALLETVLSAREHLVLLRDGVDVRTNQEIPPAVVVSELSDTVRAMVEPEERREFETWFDVLRPRQPYDEREFRPDGSGRAGPASFDVTALAGAQARRDRSVIHAEFAAGPLTDPLPDELVIDLDDLRTFLANPVKHFLTNRLDVGLPRREDAPSALLPVNLIGLDMYSAALDLLRTNIRGGDPERWRMLAEARGVLPPGGLGDRAVATATEIMTNLLEIAEQTGWSPDPVDHVPVEVHLDGGTRIVGIVADRLGGDRPGPVSVSPSRMKPSCVLEAWVDLLALTATHPDVTWRSVAIHRKPTGNKAVHVDLSMQAHGLAAHDVARRALQVAVDCYRRGAREPLPLFASTSHAIMRGQPIRFAWEGNSVVPGEGARPEQQLVHPGPPERLLARPARPDDPDGSQPGRAARFAEYLWGAVDTSVTDAGDSMLVASPTGTP